MPESRHLYQRRFSENQKRLNANSLLERCGKMEVPGLDEEEVYCEKENKLVNTQKSMELLKFDISMGEVEGRGKLIVGQKMPWDRDKKLVLGRVKKKRFATAAELNLDEELLKRLGNESARMRKWVKVKKAGVTQAIFDEVNLTWKDNELAMLKFDLPLSRNMKRAREIVEFWEALACLILLLLS